MSVSATKVPIYVRRSARLNGASQNFQGVKFQIHLLLSLFLEEYFVSDISSKYLEVAVYESDKNDVVYLQSNKMWDQNTGRQSG